MESLSQEELSQDDIDWIESFYASLEKDKGYTRPKDYIERATRVLRGDFKGRTKVHTSSLFD